MNESCNRAASREQEVVPLSIWGELLAGVELLYLQISPVYWGHGIPHGDGSAVVVVPGFLASDLYLTQFRIWLRRIGYEPHLSRIGINAECPNLLIRQRLVETIEAAYESTRRKVHLVGHSLGGMLALAAATQMRDRIASVITMGTPFRGLAVHPSVARTIEAVRRNILERHKERVLPGCYTGACTCAFLTSLKRDLPESMRQTAIYSKTDGLVDWQVCTTGDEAIDVEVSATHIGMAFSPIVYSLVAHRLAGK